MSTPPADNIQEIGTIRNYYGGVLVKSEGTGATRKYYWAIDDAQAIEWGEIPETLYTALLGYENSRKST